MEYREQAGAENDRHRIAHCSRDQRQEAAAKQSLLKNHLVVITAHEGRISVSIHDCLSREFRLAFTVGNFRWTRETASEVVAFRRGTGWPVAMREQGISYFKDMRDGTLAL